MYTLFVHEYLKIIICFHVYKMYTLNHVYRKGFKIGIQNVYMILNAENVKCIHFVYIIVYIIYIAMYTLCTFSCIHFVCITSVRVAFKTYIMFLKILGVIYVSVRLKHYLMRTYKCVGI